MTKAYMLRYQDDDEDSLHRPQRLKAVKSDPAKQTACIRRPVAQPPDAETIRPSIRPPASPPERTHHGPGNPLCGSPPAAVSAFPARIHRRSSRWSSQARLLVPDETHRLLVVFREQWAQSQLPRGSERESVGGMREFQLTLAGLQRRYRSRSNVQTLVYIIRTLNWNSPIPPALTLSLPSGS
ncbi:hypothetical protein SISSUDRAFT_527688 [Sistotremastrum suecicum HHB10207 ss-3]|uniref:Uncharacterized protein n=1 Tax=Sistotremastrum suecicum HHB10207 ss-3 TaxID=1314776 RepID=A0A165XUX5_9AGAM|nr:hypothetical protein SISSUDRAFT_527688 [Sistotremastrum suecicum HHB10207 ss-3]